MKTIYIFSNCFGNEIANYFNHIKEIKENYIIKYKSTYTNLTDFSILDEIKDVDYLLTNNIKQYKHLTPDNLKLYVKSSCKVIVFEFVRFDGFYPLKIYYHLNLELMYLDCLNSYNDFINYKIDDDIIIKHFNDSLEKFKILDENSDIKFYDFFINNYENVLLFRDKTHPTREFIKYLIKEIIKKMDIDFDQTDFDNLNLKYSHGFVFRYLPILNCVKKTLNLKFDDDNIDFFNTIISKEKFYNFAKNYGELSNKTGEIDTRKLFNLTL
jgi:hypothetical protein